MQHINIFTGGMKRGIDYSIIPQDSYSYMLNGCTISKDKHGFMVTNIKGTTSIANFSTNEVPIGSVSFNGVLYIITYKIVSPTPLICFYSLKGADGDYGWVDTLELLPWPSTGTNTGLQIPATTLGFTSDKLLEVLAKESYDGSVDLYICDGLSPNVVVNTGIDKNGIFTSRSYAILTDASLFLTQKNINVIPTVVGTVRNNGNMKPGTYYIYVRYEDESLNATPFIKEVGPFFIHAGNTSKNNSSGILNEDNARVSKNILLAITNADPNYRKVSIGIVYYYGLDDVLSRENYLLNKSYTLVGNAVNIVINGDNEIRSLLIEEILSDGLPLNRCETEQQIDNRFFGANWNGNDIDNEHLKEIASRIIPRGVLHEDNNFDGVCDENCKEFEYMENEIYPFGVSFLIDGQYKTPVFPICGWMEGLNKDVDYLLVPELPIVENAESPQILALSASVSINVSSADGMPILEKGVCWKEGTSLPFPDYNSSKTNEGTGVGDFDTTMTGLSADTEYTYRPYILTNAGTVVFGEALSLTTDDGIIDITTVLPDALAGVAYSGGNITSDGGSTVTARGICWNTSSGPTVSNDKTIDGSGLGSFLSEATGLTPGTLYYMRAYATNAVGTSYGDEYSFTTMSGIEDITIGDAYDITTVEAKVSLTIVEGSGALNIPYGGICWSTSPNPTVDDDKTEDFTDFGTFISLMIGLSPGTLYYFRGYAINEFGATYTEQKSVTALTGILDVVTLEIDPLYVGDTWANVYGEVQDNYGGGVTEFGVCYSLVNAIPTIADSKIIGSGSFASFMCVLTPLIPDMGDYYARAYAINGIGTFYGVVRTFYTIP
jgi:hypothetical protein